MKVVLPVFLHLPGLLGLVFPFQRVVGKRRAIVKTFVNFQMSVSVLAQELVMLGQKGRRESVFHLT